MGVVVIDQTDFDFLRSQLATLTSAVEFLTSHNAPYLSSKQVSEMTGFKNDWIHTHKHEIGHSLVDGQLRFKRKDVLEYMDANYTKMTIKKTSLTRLRP